MELENKQPDDNTQSSYYSNGTFNTPVESTGIGNTGPANPKPSRRQYNPLSKFSSYTYNFGLYAFTPDAYNNWVVNGKWITKDLELLVQSGGINQSLDSKRSDYFPYDLGIDDVEITSLISAKATMTASNSNSIKFKIYEPFGMQFPTDLLRAQIDIQQRATYKRKLTQPIQALASPLLLVVRFYGYDENGKLVQGLTDTVQTGDTKTDSNANFERAFPILIKNFNFRLENKVTVYSVEAVLYNEQISFGTKRGVIKTGFEVSGDTVASTIEQLLDKVNQQQEKLTAAPKDPNKPKDQTISDVYKVVFEDKSGIGDALIVDKDFYVKHYTPMPKVEKAAQVTVRLAESGAAKTVAKDKRTVKFAEGTSILTAIDQIITQSTFIKKSLDELDKEEIKKKQVQDTTVDKNADPIELFWYHVRPSTQIIGYDESRHEYAYKITYNIIKYRIPYIKSLYLDSTLKYYGPHKIYEYYYTGQNTEILDYSCNYNLLYYNIGTLGSEAANAEIKNDITPNSQEPGQNGDPTNRLPGNELINSFKTYLYSPKDQVNAQISILGDPDYLMPTQAGSEENLFKLWYGSDYSINPSSGQVFIEIGFKQVKDYYRTGTLDPNENIKVWEYPKDIARETRGRMIYMLSHVVSRFNNGVFRQDLKSIIPDFFTQPGTISSDSNSNEGRTSNNESQADSNNIQTRSEPTPPIAVSNAKPPPTNTGTTINGNIMNNVANVKSPNAKDDNTPVKKAKNAVIDVTRNLNLNSTIMNNIRNIGR